MQTMIHAHRGASAYMPENTLEAFSLAVEQKADYIELDVHLSKDTEIVVAHDELLDRVSGGTGYINDHTLNELKALNFGKLYPGVTCRIPTLAEVFDLVKPSNLNLNIEMKTIDRMYPELPGKLLALAAEFGMQDRIIYSSFNHYSLLQIKQGGSSSAKIGLLYNMGMVDPWVYAKHIKADAIHPHYSIIAALPETVIRCHENNIQVNAWTADDSKIIGLLLKCGVDGIITNKPDIAANCRSNASEGV